MEAHDTQLLVEAIKALVGINTEDAKSAYLYGAITLGFIAFSLPVLLKATTTEPWYWWLLIFGTFLLLVGGGIFIYYARQVTVINGNYAEMLKKILSDSTFDKTRLSDAAFKGFTKALVKIAKPSLIIGFFMYALAFVRLVKEKL